MKDLKRATKKLSETPTLKKQSVSELTPIETKVSSKMQKAKSSKPGPYLDLKSQLERQISSMVSVASSSMGAFKDKNQNEVDISQLKDTTMMKQILEEEIDLNL